MVQGTRYAVLDTFPMATFRRSDDSCVWYRIDDKIDINNMQNLKKLLHSIIDKFIESHTISKKAHEELIAKNGYYATVYYHQYPMAAKKREQGVK